MSDQNQVVKVKNVFSCGGLWFAAWLFTIGYLHLTLPKAFYALLLWPYYLGAHLAR